MLKATVMMIRQTIGHPQEMATGPPRFHACGYVVKHPASTEMIVNEIAKFENRDQPRFSSCL